MTVSYRLRHLPSADLKSFHPLPTFGRVSRPRRWTWALRGGYAI